MIVLKLATKKMKEEGAALTELAIILPFLLLLLAGLFNFASSMWQAQVISEATRHGARSAAFYSAQVPLGTPVNCNLIIEEAKNRFTEHLTSFESKNNKDEFTRNWGTPTACLRTLSWENTMDQYITVSVNTTPQENCIFCFDNFFNNIQNSYSSSFIIPKACANESFYQC